MAQEEGGKGSQTTPGVKQITPNRRQFAKEFKVNAVRMIGRDGRSAASVARDLGVDPNVLYRWKQDLSQHKEEAFPGHGRLMAQEEELRKLRRELSRLQEENQILKKTIGYFSQQAATPGSRGKGGN